MIHDEKDGWKRHLNYAFTFGLIFDVAIYRCRVGTMKLAPDYSEYVKKIIEMRNPYFKFFKEGTFNIPSVSLPSYVKAAEYQYGDKRIMTVWNDSDDITEVCGKTIPPQGIDIIEMDR